MACAPLRRPHIWQTTTRSHIEMNLEKLTQPAHSDSEADEGFRRVNKNLVDIDPSFLANAKTAKVV